MPLVACRECGHKISTTAAACPSCGAPARVANATAPIVNAPAAAKSAPVPVAAKVGIVAALLAIAVVGALERRSRKAAEKPQVAATPSSAASGQSTEKSLRAQTMVLIIKESLPNPDSFTAQSVLVTDAGAVCAKYRAENSFGGWSRDQAVMSADQSQAINSRHPAFQELWNVECDGKTGLETKVLFKHD